MKTYLLIKTTRKGDDNYTFGPFATLKIVQDIMRSKLDYLDQDELEEAVNAGEYSDEEDGYEIVERTMMG